MRSIAIRIAAAASILLLGACKSPLEPGNVYDADKMLAQENLAAYDYITVSYMDEQPSGRRIPVWNGDPKTLDRLPIYNAEEGEKLLLELRGWKGQEKDACFTAHFSYTQRTVIQDACR